MSLHGPQIRQCISGQLLLRARHILSARYSSTATNTVVAADVLPDQALPSFSDSRSSLSTRASALNAFEPRREFPNLPSLPRSYFLGHHAAGLDRIRALLSQIDIIVECRDFRVPFTGRNTLLENTLSDLSDARRIVCYTKRDLVAPSDHSHSRKIKERERLVREWHANRQRRKLGEIVCFSSAARLVNGKVKDEGIVGREVMSAIRKIARERWSLTGLRVLVAGMPNVGKSTLLNALRARGVKKGKTARTGADPGVTRKVSGWVKILEGWEIDGDINLQNTKDPSHGSDRSKSQSEGVYVCDTPGIFMPYVPSSAAMLKLALVGAVKDHSDIINPVTLADYLLFHLNQDPEAMALYTRLFAPSSNSMLEPTNDVSTFLRAVAHRTGRIRPGGKLDIEGAATWIVKKWRKGDLGRFGLDEVTRGALTTLMQDEAGENQGPVSISQAKRAEQERRKERSRARFAAKKAQTVT